MKIENVESFENCLKSYAPYGIAGITKDNYYLCEDCMEKEQKLIKEAIRNKDSDQWEVVLIQSCDVDPEERFCEHCGKDISVYANP